MNGQNPTEANTQPTIQTFINGNVNQQKRRRLIISLGLILLLIFITSGFITKNKEKKPSQSQKTGSNFTRIIDISITGKGINFPSVLVLAGGQVTWTNNDKVAHQIAADPYPKDDSIPGFDKNIILLKGDSRTFTFAKPGKYTYHDEKNPFNRAFQGTIVVKQ